jgi:hypothetical protein
VDVMDSLYPGRSVYLENKKMKWIIGILIGISIGIPIGFSIYHYFFMERFSCCGVYG